MSRNDKERIKKKRFFSYKAHSAWSENVALVMQVGLTMVGCVIFCFFVGLYIDRWLGTGGIFLIVFTILGVLGGANTAYRQIQQTLTKNGSKRNSDRAPAKKDHPPDNGNDSTAS